MAKDKELAAQENGEKKKKIPLSLIFCILQTAFFLAFTINGFLKRFEDSKYMPLVVALVAVYLISFVVVMTVNIRNAKKAKELAAAYKTSAQDLKLSLRVWDTVCVLVGLAASVSMLLATYSDADSGILSQIFALGSTLVAATSAFWSVFFTARKLKKRVKTEKKRRKKAQKEAEKAQRKAQ